MSRLPGGRNHKKGVRQMQSKSNGGMSLLAMSRALAPIIAAGVGFTCVTPAEAQSACTPNLLGVIICTGSPTLPPAPPPPGFQVLDVVGSLSPVTVVLQDGFQAPQTVNISTLAPAADVISARLAPLS